jgi:hypothetical protein
MRNNLTRVALTASLISFLLSISLTTFAAETRLEKALPEGGKAVLTFAGSPLQAMTEIPFTVNLTGGAGTVFTDANVSFIHHGRGMGCDYAHPAPRTRPG